MGRDDWDSDDWDLPNSDQLGDVPVEHDFFGEEPQQTTESMPVPEKAEPAEEILPVKKETAGRAIQVATMEGDSYELVEEGYHWEYVKPPLSRNAKKIGGYTRDKKPKNHDKEVEDRKRQSPQHDKPYDFKCSLSERFADKRVFRAKNILLEILQNAEPRDSKGTWFGFEFYAKGKWRSVVDQIHKFKNSQIGALRIADNGKGYLPTDMTTIGAGKREDDDAAGNFGTGMKVSDQSALELIGANGDPLEITRYSRNWMSKPYLYKERTSYGLENKLAHHVHFYEDCKAGSVVEYRNLPDTILDEARKIGDYYLPLDPTLEDRLITHNEYGLILKPKESTGSSVTVAGRHYEFMVPLSDPLLFSYDLHNCKITDQDRHYVDTSNAIENIRRIWERVEDKNMFLELFKSVTEDKSESHYEHKMKGIYPSREPFIEAAKEYLGIESFDKIYIKGKTTEKNKKILERKGFKAIDIKGSKFLEETLQNIGVHDGDDYIENITETETLSSKTEDYQKENFATCASRAVEFAERVGGREDTEILVVINKGGKEQEVPYSQFIKDPKAEIDSIVRFSVRLPKAIVGDPSLAVDIESFTRACISAGVDFYICNEAFEISAEEITGEYHYFKKIQTHMRRWEGQDPRFCINLEVNNTSTANLVKKLKNYSLRFDEEYKPVEATEAMGEVVSLDKGRIYERGVLKPGLSRDSEAILSYNFPWQVSGESYQRRIQELIEECQNIEVIKAILSYAKKNPSTEKPEYRVEPNNKEVWVKAFEEVYGEEAVIDDIDEEHYSAEDVKEIQQESKFKKPSLPTRLRATLAKCGVKRLSYAVQAATAMEYAPPPLQQTLLRVEEIIDEVITRSLDGRKRIPSRTVVVSSIKNRYGQEISVGKNAYLNPFFDEDADLTEIMIHDETLKESKFDRMVIALFEKKFELYRAQMTERGEFESKYLKAKRMLVRSMGIEQIKEIDSLKKKDAGRAAEIIEKMKKQIDMPMPDEDWEKRKVKTLEDIRRRRSSINSAVKAVIAVSIMAVLTVGAVKFSESETAGRIKAKIASVLKRNGNKSHGEISERSVEQRTDKKAKEKAPRKSKAQIEFEKKQAEFKKKEAEFKAKLEKIEKERAKRRRLAKGPGYKRPRSYQDGWKVSVNADREFVSAFGDTLPEQEKKEPSKNNKRFMAVPFPGKGSNNMREGLGNVYNGKGWDEDSKAPEFGNQGYSNNQVCSHLQRIGVGQKRIVIRTRTGSIIDPESIKFQGEGLTATRDFKPMSVNNGEYEITLPEDDDRIIGVQYRTLTPIEWGHSAQQLTDEDFGRLDQKAYEFYTQTPDLDLSKIRLDSPIFPQFDNLQKLYDHLWTISPSERLKSIRQIIREMRYAKIVSAEKAYENFYDGKTQEKDLIQFMMNSEQLDKQGDGDCDCNNTLFAMLVRFAGIPSRIAAVSSGENKHIINHGSAEVFLPKIGWISMDTMGRTVLKETVTIRKEGPVQQKRPTRVLSEEEKAALEIQRQQKELRRQFEYSRRGCEPFEE